MEWSGVGGRVGEEGSGVDMFKTENDDTEVSSARSKVFRSCILYSTDVPAHIHLRLFHIKVALEENNMHRFSTFT